VQARTRRIGDVDSLSQRPAGRAGSDILIGTR